MRKIWLCVAAVSLVLIGCTRNQTSSETESQKNVIVHSDDSSEAQYRYKFAESNSDNFLVFKDSSFYTLDDDKISCYKINNEESIDNVPLQSITYNLHNSDETAEVFYYVYNNEVHAVSNRENKADTTYTIQGNNHEFIAVNAVGFLSYAYKINIESGKAEYLFDELDKIQIKASKIVMSDDCSKMLIKADLSNGSMIDRATRTDLDCEYYYIDLNTKKLTSLNELTGVEINRYNQSDKVVAEFGFADNNTIIIITHNRENSAQTLVRYTIGGTAETSAIDETAEIALIGTGCNYSLVGIGNDNLFYLDNSNGKLTEIPVKGNVHNNNKIQNNKIIIGNQAVFDCEKATVTEFNTQDSSEYDFNGLNGYIEYRLRKGCTEYNIL